MKKTDLCAILLMLFMLSSCKTPMVGYFTDLTPDQTQAINNITDIRIQPDDKLSIVVKSKDPLLSELFNLPVISNRIGYSQSSSSNNSLQMSVYTVDSKGEIDFPVLGKVKIGGLKREEVAETIKQQLMSGNLVQDPVVTVEYANMGFNVLGEVNRPGRYIFDRDHLTLLDALSLAGDLTIQGQRENITVIREANGQRTAYTVNLQSTKELYTSPAYYIQQNDVIYVEPNKFRARQTTVNGNNVLSASFWISVASLLTSVAVLIFK